MFKGPLKHGAKSGGKVTSTYRSWQMMKNRCLNRNAMDYEYYGGKGIDIYESWKESFEEFLKDMGEAPPNHSLDRIDNTKDYAPTNCRWATRKDQSRNRDYCLLLTYKGRTMHTWEWAEELGIATETFRNRVRHYKKYPLKYTEDSVFSPNKKVKLNV